ncbi:pol [Symbiodinium sp. CCMP2592]|nr:pol [Symbiodinium sp. CCMP2592]
MAGAGSTSVEKHHGQAPQGSIAPIPRHVKRAYKRACGRAARSTIGGTWYRGQWHSIRTLGQLASPASPNHTRPTSRTRQIPNHRPNKDSLNLLSWNAGGLSSHVYQELLAWIDQQNCYQIIIIQESHWTCESDFTSGPWLCMHSSGYACSPPDRSSGILVMLSKKYFEDPAVHEPIPGRVLQVRATVKTSQLPITIVGIYQHVWRTHLSTIQNLELRRGVWHAISTIVQQTPQRHHLLIAGDFNANLTPQHPHVGGAATRSPAANHSPELQQLLAEGNLCALNTWHTPHRDTYVTPTHNSQIDFVVVRCAEAKGKAKHCTPLVRFPVAGWRQAGHRPLHAELWLRPFRRQEPAHLPAQHRCQLDVLQQAVADQTEPAQAMQTHVEARVQQLLQQSSPNASCLQASLNQILWDAAEKFFPVQPKPDNRISNNPQYKASARQTWALYARLKSASVVTFSHIWRKWRLLVQFRKASRALRQQSKDLKRAFYEQQIQEAEEAAARHDQRTLYQIVKRMAPKSYKTASRLLGPDGRLMTPSGELQAILQHGKQTFAALIDVEHPLEPDEPLHIPEQSLQDELRALKLRKAVPAHIAPAAVWKQCHACLGSCLASALNDHFALPAQQPLQHDWKDCYIKWLPKPNKPPVSVEALRPIGLQCPTTKALAGALRERLLQVLHPALASLPQFAYIKQRGTQEALLRVHMHFHQVASILKDNIVDRFQQKAGKKAAKCIGAMSLSLDLSRAFDSASRPEVYQTMLHHGVPKEVVNAVQQLHLHALYKYQVGQNSYGATSTTNGVKQGCKIAPYLWCFLTLRFMELLMQSRSEQWLAHIMTIFADDVWSNWIIRSLTDFKRAKADLELILTILESLHLTVNFTKTAILLVLEGKDAAKILRDHTVTKAGQHLLRLTVSGRDCTLPIKAQHEYLGSIVSYQGRKNLNADHRVKAGNGRYQALRRTLNGHHVLTAHNRIRLWTACVQTSAHYSLTAVGLTSKGLDKLTKASTKQLRAALRQPAHISHTTTAQIWQQAGHPLPAQQLAQSLEQYVLKQQARATTAPDITTMPQVLQYAEEQLRQLQILASTPLREERTVDEASVQTVACPECGESFASLNGMRIHSQLAHGRLPAHPKCPTTFDAVAHSVGGLPECRLCHRRFFRYQQLVKHINTGACEALGGESFIRKPVEADALQVTSEMPPATSSDSHTLDVENIPEDQLPLVRRPSFIQSVHSWASWPLQPGTRKDLLERCVLCYMIGSGNMAGENPEADIFRYCFPSGAPPSSTPTTTTVSDIATPAPTHAQSRSKRQRPDHHQRPHPPRGHHFATYQPMYTSPQDQKMMAITKLLLQHEDRINCLSLDRGLVMFLKEDTHSVLPAMMRAAREWNARKDQGDDRLVSPLRTVLLANLIKELQQRLQHVVATQEGRDSLRKAKWLAENGDWHYMKWCRKTKTLIPNEDRTPLQHTEAVRVLSFLYENLKYDIIQNFKSTQRLQHLEDQNRTSATFLLDISLRGSLAQEVYEHFEKLINCSLTGLIGMSLKKESMVRKPAATQLAQLMFGS